MGQRVVGIIMNGVTGRMGMNQHLIRSILAIREQGGIADRRRRGHLARAAARRPQRGASSRRWPLSTGSSAGRTDLDAALADPQYEIYFDAQLTSARPAAVESRDRGGQARLLREAGHAGRGDRAGARPRGARRGREGRRRPGQAVPAGPAQAPAARRAPASSGASSPRAASSATGSIPGPSPSRSGRRGTTAARTAAGSSATCSPHWRYVLDNVFGPVRSVMAVGATHIPERIGEDGRAVRGDGRGRGVRDLRVRRRARSCR